MLCLLSACQLPHDSAKLLGSWSGGTVAEVQILSLTPALVYLASTRYMSPDLLPQKALALAFDLVTSLDSLTKQALSDRSFLWDVLRYGTR
jgi:hypothetical protein